MPEITLFCEDSFHEKFIGALLRRFGADNRTGATLRILSSRGGLPTMHGELKEFLRDMERDRHSVPDSMVVVVDANCLGYNECKGQMDRVFATCTQFQQIVSYAIPDPHIELWMLADPAAFKAAFGTAK